MKLLKPIILAKKPDSEEHIFLRQFGQSLETDQNHSVLKYKNGFLITKTLREYYFYAGKTYYYFYNKNKELLWKDCSYSDNPIISSEEFDNNIKVYIYDKGIVTSKNNFYNEIEYEFLEINSNKTQKVHLKTKDKKQIEQMLNIKIDNQNLNKHSIDDLEDMPQK